MKKKSESDWMKIALEQAARGLYTAHPNPRVGCVFVKDDQLVSQGYHAVTGGPHAEIAAIQAAEDSLKDSTCFVTLEPCSHFGRTPPCVDQLIALNIKRCIIASQDPNPAVNGQGIERLEQAGIEVTQLFDTKAFALNAGFFKRMTTGLPRVIAKMASSLDGKTAMLSGESQWITGEEARQDAQRLRAQCGAVLTSWKTVSQDKAKMTVRLPEILSLEHFKQPLRVVLDQQLQIDPSLPLFQENGPILLLISETVCEQKRQSFVQKLAKPEQVTLESIVDNQHHLDLMAILKRLGSLQINEVLIESGPTLLGAFWQQNLVDTLVHYMAPKLLGTKARGMFDFDIKQLSEHKALTVESCETLGQDLKIIAHVRS